MAPGARIMKPRRLALIAASTVFVAGCVFAWVAGYDWGDIIEDTAATPFVDRLPLTFTAGAAPATSPATIYAFLVSRPGVASPNARVADAFGTIPLNAAVLADVRAALSSPMMEANADPRSSPNAIVAAAFSDAAPDSVMPSESSSADAGETPYPEKPAKVALAALSDVPLGTPVQEIERAAKAFGVDASFMKAVAKIESDFNPRQQTGSYIGLFQLSKSEFGRYGSGEILNSRDNAMAAAYKFVTEAALFKATTHMELTFANLYLIHQQGWEAAAEHLRHPQQLAWKSMCATREGMAKGERWCKRAIWGNTLPAVKREWKSVDRLTSGEFVAMWQHRVDTFYARYPAPTTQRPEA
jgi:hypothetical protein